MNFFRILSYIIAFTMLSLTNVSASGLSADVDQCFVRNYSSAHLKKNPAQLVTYMRFAHIPSSYTPSLRQLATGHGGQSAPSFLASVSVAFKDSNDLYGQDVFCSAENGQYRCGVECDRGYFMLRFKADGAALIDFRKTGGMVLNSSCGEGEGIRWLGDGTSDDMLFRVDPAPLASCR